MPDEDPAAGCIGCIFAVFLAPVVLMIICATPVLLGGVLGILALFLVVAVVGAVLGTFARLFRGD